MASGIYDPARVLFATSGLDWAGGSAAAALTVDTYAPAQTDTLWSAVSPYVRGTPMDLSGRAVNSTTGACTATDFTFTSVTGGGTLDNLVVYKYTGGSAASPTGVTLVAWWTVDELTGLSGTTADGSDVQITWGSHLFIA